MMHAYLDKVEGMPLSEWQVPVAAGWAAMFGRCGLRVAEVKAWPRYMLLPPGNQLFALEPQPQPRDPSCRRIENKEPAPFGTGFFVIYDLLHSELLAAAKQKARKSEAEQRERSRFRDHSDVEGGRVVAVRRPVACAKVVGGRAELGRSTRWSSCCWAAFRQRSGSARS